MEEFHKFASDLYNGQMKIYWDTAGAAFASEETEAATRQALEDSWADMQSILFRIERQVQRLANTRIKNIWKSKERAAENRRLVQELKEWKIDFHALISMIDIHQRRLPDQYLLASDQFIPDRIDTFGKYLEPLSEDSHLGLAHGQYAKAKGQIMQIAVLIEQQTAARFPQKDDLKTVTRLLMRASEGKPVPTGLLECLGYRKGDHGRNELVFRIPSEMDKPKTLRQLLCQGPIKKPGGGFTLNERLALAHGLAASVLTVYSARLVHKNIRSDNIVLFESLEDESSQGYSKLKLDHPVFVDWSLLRDVNTMSAKSVPVDWWTALFQHRDRLGSVMAKKAYNFGHDIYSLGICLLEIGLWESFVSPNQDTEGYSSKYKLSDRFIDMAGKLGLPSLDFSQDNSVPPSFDPAQEVFVAIAEAELPSRMGTAYAQTVNACLTCLEGGLGDPHALEGKTREQGLEFRSTIVKPLLDVRI